MRSLLLLAFSVVIGAHSLRADEPESAQDWLGWFAARWDDEAWVSGRRRAYMRPLDDQGWQARMLAMQGIAATGKDAVAPLVAALKSDHTPTRLLAAQTLGYLAPHVPREPLVEALENDPDAAVRLYAVDALGMQGGKDLTKTLASRRASERNRDTKKHIAYALERKKEIVDPSIIDSLIKWDSRQINSAEIGKPAPDFQLTTVSGAKYQLSDFQRKKHVVLVFVYGDT
jgi:hypothetical protein